MSKRLMIKGGMKMNSCCSQTVLTHSVLTCPFCGNEKVLEMPSDSCLFFHQCEACHEVISPKSGDCCVFCSYGSVKCPPIQASHA